MAKHKSSEEHSGRARTGSDYGWLLKAVFGGIAVLVISVLLLGLVIGSGVSSFVDAKAHERMIAAAEREAQIPAVVAAAEAQAREDAALADARAARADETAASQLAQENAWRWLLFGLVLLLIVVSGFLFWQYILYRKAMLLRVASAPNVQTQGNITTITPVNGVPMIAYQNLPAIAAPQVTNGLQLQVADAAVVQALGDTQFAQLVTGAFIRQLAPGESRRPPCEESAAVEIVDDQPPAWLRRVNS